MENFAGIVPYRIQAGCGPHTSQAGLEERATRRFQASSFAQKRQIMCSGKIKRPVERKLFNLNREQASLVLKGIFDAIGNIVSAGRVDEVRARLPEEMKNLLSIAA